MRAARRSLFADQIPRRTVLGAVAGLVAVPWRRVANARPQSARSLVGREIYSESVYVDGVSDDGRTAFIARIGRYPSLGASWIWGHAFHDGRVLAFTDHAAPCSEARTDLDSAEVVYGGPADGTDVRIERRGPRSRPDACRVAASFGAHQAAHAPHGAGPVPVRLAATFEPDHDSVSSLSGRTEVLGRVEAELTLDGDTVPLRSRGHFHEQVRSTPRWVAPFCYATLRGPAYHSVAIKLARGAVGFVLREGRVDEVVDLEIEAPAPPLGSRRVVIHLEGGERLTATYHDTYVYSVPIGEVRRRGSIVRGEVTGVPVSGCVNDYLPERLDYLPREA